MTIFPRDVRTAIRRWRSANDTTQERLAILAGDDTEAGVVIQWLSGSRDTCPVGYRVAISVVTGIRLNRFLSVEERAMMRSIVECVARDSAA